MLRFVIAIIALNALPASAMIFPHIDYSPHLERGRPGEESFGTLLDEPAASAIDHWPAMPRPEYPRQITQNMESVIQSYEDALESGEAETAVAEAMQLLETIATDLGDDHMEYFYALSDLGAAHVHAGQFAEAIRPLERAIAAIKREHGVFSDILAGSYGYLGMAYQGMEKHEEALDALSRAQHITHRHYGAMNPYQAKLVYAKADSWMALDEMWETEEMLRFTLKLAQDHYGEDSIDALPARFQLAEWLRGSGQFRPALTLYREAMLALAGENGEDTPEMIPAMRGMAATFLLQQDVEVDRGLSLHFRIAELVDQHPERFTPAQRAEAHLDLGDWLILFEREEEAWDQYRVAWEIAQQAGDDALLTDLGEPKLIYSGPNLTLDFLGYQFVDKEVFNDFTFRIREDGRPSHVKVTDSNLPMLTRRRSQHFLRLGKFRPAIVDGEPVEVKNYAIRKFYPTDPPADYGKVLIGGNIGREPMSSFERRWPGNDR